jgi:hypothetical protein
VRRLVKCVLSAAADASYSAGGIRGVCSCGSERVSWSDSA